MTDEQHTKNLELALEGLHMTVVTARALGVDQAGVLVDALELALAEIKRLTEHAAGLAAETHTLADHGAFDLTISYRDSYGGAWTPIGWLVPFDGVPVPYLECNGLACDLEDVIATYGPITPDPDTDAAGRAGEPAT